MVQDRKDHHARTRTTKGIATIRVDRKVIDWFKAQGVRYQTRMNAVLRAMWKRICRRTDEP